MNRESFNVLCKCIVGDDGEIEAFCLPHMRAVDRITRPLESKYQEAKRVADELKDMPVALGETRKRLIALEIRHDHMLSKLRDISNQTLSILNIEP